MSKSAEPLYPLLFEPLFKNYVWGGRNLEVLLGRKLPEGRIAESWEIAAHNDGVSIVSNGPYAGFPLTEVQKLLGTRLIGTNNSWAEERGKFPLLIKLLDAHDKLSIQVHPDDEFAKTYENDELGKTEMWVILHAEPNAEIILGVRPGTTPGMFREAIASGTVEEHIHRIHVQRGDIVCVPSGTVHAIMSGVVVAEIQQNSNTTYRVYDWMRNHNGAMRELHIDKAMQVIDFSANDSRLTTPLLLTEYDGVRRELLCRNQYFTTERIEFEDGKSFSGMLDGSTLEIWGVLNGEISINTVDLHEVQFTLLPATLGPYQVHAYGAATCLRVYVE